jgi:hypothetical protein
VGRFSGFGVDFVPEVEKLFLGNPYDLKSPVNVFLGGVFRFQDVREFLFGYSDLDEDKPIFLCDADVWRFREIRFNVKIETVLLID